MRHYVCIYLRLMRPVLQKNAYVLATSQRPSPLRLGSMWRAVTDRLLTTTLCLTVSEGLASMPLQLPAVLTPMTYFEPCIFPCLYRSYEEASCVSQNDLQQKQLEAACRTSGIRKLYDSGKLSPEVQAALTGMWSPSQPPVFPLKPLFTNFPEDKLTLRKMSSSSSL